MDLLEGKTETSFQLSDEIKYPLTCVTFLSVVISITIIVELIKNRAGNFFKWMIVDRFTVYTVTSDLLFYLAQTALGIHVGIVENPENVTKHARTIYAFVILEFAYCQIILSNIMGFYMFALITRSRRISFGRYDYRLLVPMMGLPAFVLAAAVYFDKLQMNKVCCSFSEEQGLITWNFLAYFMVIVVSFVIILVIYMMMWCHVYKTSKVLQHQSAVNATRVAFKLSMYSLVYVIQFGANAVEGLWVAIEDPPTVLRYVVIIVSASGGILNGIVHLTIHKKRN